MSLTLGAWSGLGRIAAPALRIMLRRRLAVGKEIAGRLPEREGIESLPRPDGLLFWLHAASLGETASVLPVIAALAQQPGTILVTTGTVTAARLLEQRLPLLGLENRVLHRFVPLDVPAWACRFLDHWRPDAAGFVESEIWPNLLAAARRRGVPLMLINARLSARSLKRWRRVPGAARAVLGGFALIHPQSQGDADRLTSLAPQHTHILPPGNLKLAAAPLPVDNSELSRLSSSIGGPVWVAASLHRGEDELILAAHKSLAATHPGLLTIMVPRHPEPGEAVAELAGGAPRRALGQLPPRTRGVGIADTVGELGLIYRLAPLAFLGGSLVPHGGQNPAEPARLGRAVAIGPHHANFVDTVALLSEDDALAEIADVEGLIEWVDGGLRDPWGTQARGKRGAALLEGFTELPEEVAGLLRGLEA